MNGNHEILIIVDIAPLYPTRLIPPLPDCLFRSAELRFLCSSPIASRQRSCIILSGNKNRRVRNALLSSSSSPVKPPPAVSVYQLLFLPDLLSQCRGNWRVQFGAAFHHLDRVLHNSTATGRTSTLSLISKVGAKRLTLDCVEVGKGTTNARTRH